MNTIRLVMLQVLWFWSLSILAQSQIQLTVNGVDEAPITFFTESVNDQIVLRNQPDTMWSQNGIFTVDLDIDHPTSVNFFLPHKGQTRFFALYLMPGDTLAVHYDFSRFMPQGDKYYCEFVGPNAPGHRYFYNYSYVPPIDHMEGLLQVISNGQEGQLFEAVVEEIDRLVAPLDSLLKRNEISKEYHQAVRCRIETTMVSSVIGRLFGNANAANLSHLSRLDRAKIVERLFDHYPPLQPERLYGAFGATYATSYHMFLRTKATGADHFFDLPDSTINFKNKKYQLEGAFATLADIPDEALREYLFAKTLVRFYSIMIGIKDFSQELAFFQARFPNSRYTGVILAAREDNQRREKELNHKAVSKGGSARPFEKWWPVIIDGAGAMENLDLEKNGVVKGQNFYVDIWATWCGPCLAEMQYNYQADSLLEANGIERIYISIDKMEDKEIWFNKIYELNLGGYHILAGSALQAHLTQALGIAENVMVIPRYIFIKNGQIVNKKAARPSEFNRLARQVDLLYKKP